jgi:CRP/FNR family cyclic AMP-dependent transcriptional regulator
MMGTATSRAEQIPAIFLNAETPGRRVRLERGQSVFLQGESSDAIYLIISGRIRLSVASPVGKEATVALLGRNELFGEQCLLLGRRTRLTTARALGTTELVKVELRTMNALLKSDVELANFVLKRVIAKMAHYEEALVHQILNNAERRLARALLHLSKYDSTSSRPIVIEDVSQELLAEMTGSSRSKINAFMTKFRRLGYIEYTGRRIEVKPSLVSVLLQPKT